MIDLREVLKMIGLVKIGKVKRAEIGNVTIYRVGNIVRVDIKDDEESN